MKKMNLNKRLFFAFVLILACFLASNYAFAAFNISAVPYEGGSDLRFGKVSNIEPYTNKELVVNISSDIGKQYQVIQTLLDPLSNNEGITLPRENFSVYGLRGSNAYGTLSVEHEISVSPMRTVIYTSNPSGTPDSLKLVYVLKSPFNLSSGDYRGRIALTLEPIGATQEPVTVVLNIFAEIDLESSVEIKTAAGSKVISLSSSRDELRSSEVLVDIKGGMGSQFNIYQALDRPLESSEGARLSYEAVNFKISGVRKGSGPAQSIPFSQRQDLIYASNTRGDSESFVVTYNLVNPEKQKAGRYRGSLNYFLDGVSGKKLVNNLDLEVDIPRVFDLNIIPEVGGSMHFPDLKLNEPPKRSEAIIEIKSNIGRQYQVNQRITSGLTNKEGRAIPTKNFTLKEESLETKGALRFLSPSEAKTGDTILFISDKNGSSDKFKMIYELSPSSEIISGDYSGSISYTISEI